MTAKTITNTIDKNIQQISLILGLNTPTSPGIYTAILCDTLDSLGYPSEQLLQKISLVKSDLLQPGVALTPSIFFKTVSAALDITQRPDLGLEYGKRIDLLCGGLAGQAVLTAPTIFEAAKRGIKYARLCGVNLKTNFFNNDGIGFLAYEMDWISVIPQHHQHFYIEMFLAIWQKHLRYLTHSQQCFKQISIRYAPPEHAKAYYEHFNTEILFNAPTNWVSIEENLATQALTGHCDSLSNQVLMQCEEALANLPQHDSWTQKVMQVLNTINNHHFPDINSIAQQLAISPRSLMRHLEQEGSTYKSLVNKKRLHHSCKLLLQTRHSVDAIANEIGFSDASNFRKAFKKWTGKTPKEYRHVTRL